MFAEIPKLLRQAHKLSRRLWVRITLISALSLLAIAAAKVLDPLIPEGLAGVIGAEALDHLLSIISSSMLAVTTFSVTIMVSVYVSVAQQWTPRAHILLLQDPTTQTVLATFIGAYIYSLVSIILLATPYFGEKEVVTLYLATILVLAMIVFALVRWILQLSSLGSLVDTAGRIERVATQAFEHRMRRPRLGAQTLDRARIPASAVALRARSSLYLQEIYADSLQACAEAAEAEVHVVANIGDFIVAGATYAFVTTDDEAALRNIEEQFHFGALRTIEQDPRFGLIQLSEIGSKALSPGINDPGTAIDVARRLARILATVDDESLSGEGGELDRIYLNPLNAETMVRDAFASLARDGARQVEVLIAIQKCLSGLVSHASAPVSAAARDMLKEVYARGTTALSFDRDLERLAQVTPEASRS